MILDLQQGDDSPLERNSFGFAKLRDEENVDVTLDLTPYTDEFWQERILPFFEIEVLQGSRTLADGRIIYQLQLSSERAKILESAIMNALLVIQSQQN